MYPHITDEEKRYIEVKYFGHEHIVNRWTRKFKSRQSRTKPHTLNHEAIIAPLTLQENHLILIPYYLQASSKNARAIPRWRKHSCPQSFQLSGKTKK